MKQEIAMSPVSHVASTAIAPDVARVYEEIATGYGPFCNQAAAMAHVPSGVRHIMGLLLELKKQKSIQWRYIELVIVVTSKLNQCHTGPVMVEGLSQPTINRLPNVEGSPDLDESTGWWSSTRSRSPIARIASWSDCSGACDSTSARHRSWS
jgi:hypothetical protein